MKKLWIVMMTLAGLTLLAGCETGAPHPAVSPNPVTTVAVVSLDVNNYGFSGAKGTTGESLLQQSVNRMLGKTESLLGQHWTVKPAASFVGDAAFRQLSAGAARSGLFAPTIAGQPLPNFTDNPNELARCILKPETARTLCKTLGVDAVIVVYSEWMTDSGRYVPSVKALTKNAFAMYGKDGKQIFFERENVFGKKLIADNVFTQNEGTIAQWVNAYSRGAETVFKRHSAGTH